MDEPTVRVTRRLRRGKGRRPKGAAMVATFRVEDHPGGPAYASFASPDGAQWKAYAYFPQNDEPAERYLLAVDENGDFVTDEHGEVIVVREP